MAFSYHSFEKHIPAYGISLLRIFFAIFLIYFIIKDFYFVDLYQSYKPFVENPVVDLRYIYPIWVLSAFFLLIGLFTRVMAVVNFIIIICVWCSILTFQYHIQYASLYISFSLILFPSNQFFSIDNLLHKLKHNKFIKKEIRQSYVNFILFYGLGIVYFTSVFNKFFDWMYMSGLGLWLPASLPFNVVHDYTLLLNNEYLMKFSGYVVLFFELFFVFVFFRKKFRVAVMLLGILFHSGIIVFFSIYGFGFSCLIMYVLLVPTKYYSYFVKRLKSLNLKKLFIAYDENCKICTSTKIIFEHFDLFNSLIFISIDEAIKNHVQLKEVGKSKMLKSMYSINHIGVVKEGLETYIRIFYKLIFLAPIGILFSLPIIKQTATFVYNKIAVNRYSICHEGSCLLGEKVVITEFKTSSFFSAKVKHAFFVSFVVFISFIQLFQFLRNDYMFHVYFKNDITNYLVKNKTCSRFSIYTTKLLGIDAHGVYHYTTIFKNYEKYYTVFYINERDNTKQMLPFFKEDGLSDFYNTDRSWLKYTLRSGQREKDWDIFKKSIQRYIYFWAGKNNINLKDAKFLVAYKSLDSIKGFEKNYLKKMINKKWINSGLVEYKNNELNFDKVVFN